MRICTIGVPRFVHDGLEVSAAWTEVDLATMPALARKALLDYTGQLVRIHPDDVGQLAAAGLEVYTEGNTGRERIRKAAPPATAPRVPSPGTNRITGAPGAGSSSNGGGGGGGRQPPR